MACRNQFLANQATALAAQVLSKGYGLPWWLSTEQKWKLFTRIQHPKAMALFIQDMSMYSPIFVWSFILCCLFFLCCEYSSDLQSFWSFHWHFFSFQCFQVQGSFRCWFGHSCHLLWLCAVWWLRSTKWHSVFLRQIKIYAIMKSTYAVMKSIYVSWKEYTPSWKANTPSWKAYTPSWKEYTPSWKAYTPSWKEYTPSWKAYTPSWKASVMKGVYAVMKSITPSWKECTPSWKTYTPL